MSEEERVTELIVEKIAGETIKEFIKREIKKGWHCECCDSSLPKKGFVWKHRFDEWRRGKDLSSSGYYCDSCADAIEQGIDLGE